VEVRPSDSSTSPGTTLLLAGIIPSRQAHRKTDGRERTFVRNPREAAAGRVRPRRLIAAAAIGNILAGMLSAPSRTRAPRRPAAAARPPRRRRPGERPQELLDAALRVFAARGYRNTRLEEVAAEAGVTKGAVYHYFPDKEALLLRAIERHQARSLGRLEDALRGETGSASSRLSLVLRRAFGGDDPARRDVLVLLQGIAHESPGVYRRWIANGPVKGWKLVASLIEEGKAAGEFRSDVDSEVAARVVITGMLAQVILQKHAEAVPAVRIDRERLSEGTIAFLLSGLAAPRARARRAGRARKGTP